MASFFDASLMRLLRYESSKSVSEKSPSVIVPVLSKMMVSTLQTVSRTLLSLTITSGSVVRREDSVQPAGTRVDLSCGRIELYAVIPLGGPAPGPGHPGDCGP